MKILLLLQRSSVLRRATQVPGVFFTCALQFKQEAVSELFQRAYTVTGVKAESSAYDEIASSTLGLGFSSRFTVVQLLVMSIS